MAMLTPAYGPGFRTGPNDSRFGAYSTDRTQKRCRTCKQWLTLDRYRRRGSKGIRNDCKRCDAVQVDEYRHMTKDGVTAEIVRRFKYICRIEGLPFDLTKEAVRAKLDAQEWRCALSNLPLNWQKEKGQRKRGYQWDSVSTDRLVASRGYVIDNVRFVLNIVNCFRNDGGDERMYAIAEALLQHRDTIQNNLR